MTAGLKTQFVTCPKCDGLTKDEKGLVCPECGGIGLGTFIKNDFLYWGYDMTPAKIIVRQSQVIFNYVVNIICLLLGIGGILFLVLWLKDNALAENYKIYLGTLVSFWGVKDSYILYFWIGLLFLLFAYFRYSRMREKQVMIRMRSYRQQKKFLKKQQIIPNNWQELKTFKTKIDVSKSYSSELIKLIDKAYSLAMEMKHQEVLLVHVLMTAILEQDSKKQTVIAKRVSALFARLNIYKGKLGPKLESALKNIETKDDNHKVVPIISKELRQGLIEAYLQAVDNKHHQVMMLDLINSLIQEGMSLKKVFQELNVELDQIANTIQWLLINDQLTKKKYQHQKAKLQQGLDLATSAIATPILNHFCKNLTQQARAVFPEVLINREQEFKEIFQAFTNKKKQIILTGRGGTGKQAIIKCLAERIVNDNVPRVLRRKKLLQLDIAKLKREAAALDLEKKLLVVIQELKKSANAVLVVKALDSELWDVLSRYSSTFYLLATSPKKLSGADVCNIEIGEPEHNDLIQILASTAAQLEHKYKVSFKYDALEAAIQASREHLSEEALPASAVRVLTQAATKYAAAIDKNITAAVIANFVSKVVGVGYTKILKHS